MGRFLLDQSIKGNKFLIKFVCFFLSPTFYWSDVCTGPMFVLSDGCPIPTFVLSDVYPGPTFVSLSFEPSNVCTGTEYGMQIFR